MRRDNLRWVGLAGGFERTIRTRCLRRQLADYGAISVQFSQQKAAKSFYFTFPPQQSPNTPHPWTDGHLSFASTADWITMGKLLGVNAFSILNFCNSRAFSSVSVGYQLGSPGLSLK